MAKVTPTIDNHDHLDKQMETVDYTAATCGSLNATTGKPEYCSFDCPTLKAANQGGGQV